MRPVPSRSLPRRKDRQYCPRFSPAGDSRAKFTAHTRCALRRHQRLRAAGLERKPAVRPELAGMGGACQLCWRPADHDRGAGGDARASPVVEDGERDAVVGVERRTPGRRLHPADDPAAAIDGSDDFDCTGRRRTDVRGGHDGPFRRLRTDTAPGVDSTPRRHRTCHRRRSADQGLKQRASGA
jgi:hypothetical protein